MVAPPRYVSRGGEKLETALRAFAIDVTGERCLDVGASTGGFTDCLLQHGAAHGDRRGRRPRPAARAAAGRSAGDRAGRRQRAQPGAGPAAVSRRRSSRPTCRSSRCGSVLPAVVGCLAERWRGVVLVKPQFEAGRDRVRKGVVRDPEVHRRGAARCRLGGPRARRDRPRSVRFFAPRPGRQPRVPDGAGVGRAIRRRPIRMSTSTEQSGTPSDPAEARPVTRVAVVTHGRPDRIGDALERLVPGVRRARRRDRRRRRRGAGRGAGRRRHDAARAAPVPGHRRALPGRQLRPRRLPDQRRRRRTSRRAWRTR